MERSVCPKSELLIRHNFNSNWGWTFRRA